MKKITFLLMMSLMTFMANAQFSFNAIKTDGFEIADGMPDAFTRIGQATWVSATPSYTGGFWDLIYASAAPKDYTVTSVSDEKHSGTKSIKITTGTSNVALRIRSNSAGTPVGNLGVFAPSIGDWGKYKVTLWAKGVAGSQIFNAITTPATGGWDKYEFTSNYSTGVSEVRLMIDLKSTAGTSATIYLDDLLVEQYASTNPSTSAATDIASTTFNANWSSISGATNYRLTLQSTVDGTTWTNVSGYPATVDGGATVQKGILGLSPLTKYRYKIEGFDGAYYSPSSNYTEVTTLDTPTGILDAKVAKSYVLNGAIYTSAKVGEEIKLVNSVGQTIKSIVAVEGVNIIPVESKGIVFVKVGNAVTKLIVK